MSVSLLSSIWAVDKLMSKQYEISVHFISHSLDNIQQRSFFVKIFLPHFDWTDCNYLQSLLNFQSIDWYSSFLSSILQSMSLIVRLNLSATPRHFLSSLLGMEII
jgi:hypothetical protein